MIDELSRLSGLATRALGRPHEHHARLDSTNARAAVWAAAGAPHGALVTADEQTAGRGRRGRAWHSPRGEALYATAVVRPGRPGAELGALALAVGLGLHEGLSACGVARPQLKWPNDVLVDGLKLAGILCEARWSGPLAEVVVGFGINVHNGAFPAELSGTATSLRLAMDEAPDRATVLVAVLTALEPVLDEFFRAGFRSIKARYLAACVTIGREVVVGDTRDPSASTLVGTADSLDDDGALWVRAAGGRAPVKVQAADVWLAPAG